MKQITLNNNQYKVILKECERRKRICERFHNYAPFDKEITREYDLNNEIVDAIKNAKEV